MLDPTVVPEAIASGVAVWRNAALNRPTDSSSFDVPQADHPFS